MVGKKVGLASLPLHTGHAPYWLFKRMIKLSKAISEIIIYEYGNEEFIKRLADPFFFQSLGCVIGFDYHSSGVTTTTLGALKIALSPEEHGIEVTGGKGIASRKTPDEIENACNYFSLSQQKIEKLKYASKTVAKVDAALIQCNPAYQLYLEIILC